MMKGVYCYYDLEMNTVIYIGKDSHIGRKNRYNAHKSPSKYDAQPINRVIQNNLERYEYKVICEYQNLTDDELKWMECMEIMKHKFLYDNIPKFNFDVGGDGNTGFRHSDRSKQLMSENHHKYWEGKTLTIQHCKNQSSARNTTGFFRVSTQKDKTCTKGFMWTYRYRVTGKQKTIRRASLKSLEEEVKRRGLEWMIIDEDKMNKSLKLDNGVINYDNFRGN